MARAPHRPAWAALLVLLTISAAAHADEPAPPALSAPAPPASSARLAAPLPSASGAPARGAVGAHLDLTCSDAVVEWTERASTRTGLTITPVACPPGLVRLKVEGAGCDFEVSRDHGFQRTEGGAFGVSPIVDLDWTTAPEPMKKGLTGILAALAADPALSLGNKRSPRTWSGSLRNRIIVGSALLVILAAAVALRWKRARGLDR